jgi:hypothetical protein
MRRHSHRHRSASRHPTSFRRVASAAVLVIGLFTLACVCWFSPARPLLIGAAAIPALYAFVRLAYLAGRTAAKIRNAFALHAARADLEKIMRAQHTAHHAP